jgi:hypothetical protein
MRPERCINPSCPDHLIRHWHTTPPPRRTLVVNLLRGWLLAGAVVHLLFLGILGAAVAALAAAVVLLSDPDLTR